MNRNELSSTKVKFTVAGEEIEVNAADQVENTVRRILDEKGIDSFALIVDGEEVTRTADLPATFGDHDIEVKRYVKAGC